jgi:S-formylglutathione hydrolase FrmB
VPSVSRRTVLLGGVGLGVVLAGGGIAYELIQDGTLPGKYELATLDGACGSAPPAPSGPAPSRHAVSFFSAYRHRQVQMITLVPAGVSPRGLAVVLALHGAGSDAAAMADQIAPAITEADVRGFAVVCVDGGDTYWHRRADGDDPVGMIRHEVLPRAAASGLATGRIGVTGESMGGYGALLLAEQLAGGGIHQSSAFVTMPDRTAEADAIRSARKAALALAGPAVAAVAALSPAIFASYADARAANQSSFDSPADFARNSVFAGLRALRRVPTWIACGDDDPFSAETQLLCDRLAAVTRRAVPGGILSGCHDDAFWERNMPAALQFIARKLF